MKNRVKMAIVPLLLALCLVFAGCGQTTSTGSGDTADRAASTEEATVSDDGENLRTEADDSKNDSPAEDLGDTDSSTSDGDADDGLADDDASDGNETADAALGEDATADDAEDAANATTVTENTSDTTDTGTVTLDAIPDYDGTPYVVVNDNVPYFTEDDLTTEAFETYSSLDSLGRCGVAYANICQELMPTEKRGSIGSVKPTGWHTVKYDNVDGNYLYNRCHLIAYELAGENANEKNLITGTRYFNVQGMLPFENLVTDYVKETDHHVLYRVTPIFDGDNLVADGVLMEAKSVEDAGVDVQFCVFCYNVQPGIGIDYATGDSWESDSGAAGDTSTASSGQMSTGAYSDSGSGSTTTSESSDGTDGDDEEYTYILNTNTKKFHYPDCSSVAKMSEGNKQGYSGSRDELLEQGYSPCGICNP